MVSKHAGNGHIQIHGHSLGREMQAVTPRVRLIHTSRGRSTRTNSRPCSKPSSPLRSSSPNARGVDKAELASVIQDAATASSSIIDETMAMLNEQDTLDNVKAKLKNYLLTYNDDERRHDLRKLS